MTDASRYPLSWPFGWPRTPAADRQRSDFSETTMVDRRIWNSAAVRSEIVQKKGTKRVTMPTARDRLTDQLARLGAEDPLMSTNVELTSYGLPRAGRAEPADPGVAVYFQLHGKDRVLACDRWATVAENIAALAAHIDAIRRVDRYGVGTLDQAFAGYDALPPPGAGNRAPWRTILEAETLEDAERHWRVKARTAHPDNGGSHEAMAALNAAITEARKEMGA